MTKKQDTSNKNTLKQQTPARSLTSGAKKGRREFWQGNYAVAEGALAGGCNFYAGYPITPSSDIFHYLAKKLPQVGGICLQMEDEIASIAAMIGASWTGAKAMTATSGPGFSLMQENVGYAIMTETPCVIVNVMRAGPSTGQATLTGAGDVYQVRYGSHCSDYEIISLAASTVPEAYSLTIESFNLAEKYRVPVILLLDEHIGHLNETVVITDKPKILHRKRPSSKTQPIFGPANDGDLVPPMPDLGDGYKLLITGSTHDEFGWRQTKDPQVHRNLVKRLSQKILVDRDKIIKLESNKSKASTIGIISYGSASRIVAEVISRLSKDDSKKIADLRLISLWPFPETQVAEFMSGLKHVIVPEYNSGLLVREFQRFRHLGPEVHSITQFGGGEPITPAMILDKVGEYL
jgi:2-oxoglutarate ferredoxin oxidoreductase subunit alpha